MTIGYRYLLIELDISNIDIKRLKSPRNDSYCKEILNKNLIKYKRFLKAKDSIVVKDDIGYFDTDLNSTKYFYSYQRKEYITFCSSSLLPNDIFTDICIFKGLISKKYLIAQLGDNSSSCNILMYNPIKRLLRNSHKLHTLSFKYDNKNKDNLYIAQKNFIDFLSQKLKKNARYINSICYTGYNYTIDVILGKNIKNTNFPMNNVLVQITYYMNTNILVEKSSKKNNFTVKVVTKIYVLDLQSL